MLTAVSSPFFNYLLEGKYMYPGLSSHVQVNDIPDSQLKFIVEKVSGCMLVIFYLTHIGLNWFSLQLFHTREQT